MNLRIELWQPDTYGMWWPKLIKEPTGEIHLPPWDENIMDLRPVMEKYIGQEIDIYKQGMLFETKKLIKVDKIGFETE